MATVTAYLWHTPVIIAATQGTFLLPHLCSLQLLTTFDFPRSFLPLYALSSALLPALPPPLALRLTDWTLFEPTGRCWIVSQKKATVLVALGAIATACGVVFEWYCAWWTGANAVLLSDFVRLFLSPSFSTRARADADDGNRPRSRRTRGRSAPLNS